MSDPIGQMASAYLDAAIFTDCGDEGQPPSDSEFSEEARHQAWCVCRSFYFANSDLIKLGASGEEFNVWERAGHDLWFSRNLHGTGFWDRPEVWGEYADTLSRCARTIGEVCLYRGDDGLLYFS